MGKWFEIVVVADIRSRKDEAPMKQHGKMRRNWFRIGGQRRYKQITKQKKPGVPARNPKRHMVCVMDIPKHIK